MIFFQTLLTDFWEFTYFVKPSHVLLQSGCLLRSRENFACIYCESRGELSDQPGHHPVTRERGCRSRAPAGGIHQSMKVPEPALPELRPPP